MRCTHRRPLPSASNGYEGTNDGVNGYSLSQTNGAAPVQHDADGHAPGVIIAHCTHAHAPYGFTEFAFSLVIGMSLFDYTVCICLQLRTACRAIHQSSCMPMAPALKMTSRQHSPESGSHLARRQSQPHRMSCESQVSSGSLLCNCWEQRVHHDS